MKNKLRFYLNDHLAGSAGGLMLATHLAKTATTSGEKAYFEDLQERIAEEREILSAIIENEGENGTTVNQALGVAAAKIGVWRCQFNGTDMGEFGRFEMIELLSVGIYGKRLLWLFLADIAASLSLPDYDFSTLAEEALQQRETIEEYRICEGRLVFRE